MPAHDFSEGAVAIIPYDLRREPVDTLPLDALNWPLGRQSRLAHGTVADMGPQDHIVTYPTTALYLRRSRSPARLSLVIVEPDAIHWKHALLAALFFWRFHRILTRNHALLRWLPNARPLVFGSTQITDPQSVNTVKDRHLSLIASGKRDLEGHRLRHQIVDSLRDRGIAADILGRGYAPFDQKEDGLAPYHYSIIIENVRERSYFTEKLVDALICRTIPIYWGAPDIAQYFDPAGMIICTSADDILHAISSLPETPTPDMLDAAERNRTTALAYANLDRRIAETILGTFTAKAP